MSGSSEKKFDAFFERAFWGLIAIICTAGITVGGYFGRQFLRVSETIGDLKTTMALFTEELKNGRSVDEAQNRRLDSLEDANKQRNRRH